MLILGIDTCCAAATAALLEEDRLLAQTVLNLDQTHSQKLMPQVEFLFRQAETAPAAVDCFAAAVGPGSFTGVRIGVATAKALAQAVEKPCAAVSSLEALAYNVTVFPGLLCPILDARREQVYTALFQGGGPGPVRLGPDRALALTQLLTELDALAQPVLFCGDGVPVFRPAIEAALGARAAFAPVTQRMNLGCSVAALGLERFRRGETLPYSQLVPQYIRLSQAERERLAREEANQKGGAAIETQ